MKKKSTYRSSRPKKEILSESEKFFGFQLPPDCEALIGKPNLEAISHFFPHVKNFHSLAAFFSVTGIDLGIAVPEWAKKAAKKFLETTSLDCLVELDEKSPAQMGKAVGLLEIVPPIKNKKLRSEVLENIGANFSRVEKTKAAHASADESKIFFNERANAGNVLDKLKGSSQRTKVYGFIAFIWPVVEEYKRTQKFKSTQEFFDWLKTIKGKDGTTLIASSTDPREIRKICKTIGLTFENKWQKSKVKIPAPVAKL